MASKHTCLTCGGVIGEDQEEDEVAGRTTRYLHVNYEDCQAELAGPSALSVAERAYRIRGHEGRVSKLPGLGGIEDWDRRG